MNCFRRVVLTVAKDDGACDCPKDVDAIANVRQMQKLVCRSIMGASLECKRQEADVKQDLTIVRKIKITVAFP